MRFTCEKNTLLTGLNITGRTVAQKSAISAIEGILFAAGEPVPISRLAFALETDPSDIEQAGDARYHTFERPAQHNNDADACLSCRRRWRHGAQPRQRH